MTDEPAIQETEAKAIDRKQFLKKLLGWGAGTAAVISGAAAIAYSHENKKSYSFDLAAYTAALSLNDNDIMSSEAQSSYTAITNAWAHAETSETNKLFWKTLSDLSSTDEDTQGAVLARLLYRAAKEHKPAFMADLLCYCPYSYNIQFVGGTEFEHPQEGHEGSVGIMDLLTTGRNLGLKDTYDIAPWSQSEIEALNSYREKVNRRISPSTQMTERLKRDISSILHRS